MKKLGYVMMIALAVYAMQGCNNAPKGINETTASLNNNTNDTAGTDTKDAIKADSAGTKAGATGTAQKKATTPGNPYTGKGAASAAPKAPMTVDAADARLATAMAEDNLAGVSLSVIALQITKDKKIEAFADTTITGRNKINDELTAVAKKKNVLLPTSVSIEVQQKMVSLSKRSGKDFDKAYIDAIGSADEKALNLYQDAANNAADADLKAFAAKNKAVMQKNLDAITKIRAGLK